jgi:hypothetical protein
MTIPHAMAVIEVGAVLLFAACCAVESAFRSRGREP